MTDPPFRHSARALLYSRYADREQPPPWSSRDLSPAERAAHLDLLNKWVAFLNAIYTWHPNQLIPPCWPLHTGLERELSTLYWTYYEAFEEEHASPSSAQVWHDRYLAGFHNRLTTWTARACQQGTHQPRPTQDLIDQHAARTDDMLQAALDENPPLPPIP